MKFEPDGLFGGEFGCGFAEVADGFESKLAGDAVCLIVRRGFEGGGPAVGCFEDFGQGAPQVGMAWAIVVEVIGEFVSDGCELIEEVVGVLLATGAARLCVEIGDFLCAEVEEFDECEDTVGGVVAEFANLFDLGLGEGVVGMLGVQGRGEDEESEQGVEGGLHGWQSFGVLLCARNKGRPGD